MLSISFIFIPTYFFKDWRENTFGKINTDIINAFNIYERVSLRQQESWAQLDPAVVAIALSNIPLEDGSEPDFVTEYKFSKNDIILCGKYFKYSMTNLDINYHYIYFTKLLYRLLETLSRKR